MYACLIHLDVPEPSGPIPPQNPAQVAASPLGSPRAEKIPRRRSGRAAGG